MPEGGLIDLIGEEDMGKGFFSVYILSQLTRGKLSGKYEGGPINVQVVAYEDDRSEWDKRLAAASADLSRVSYLEKSDGSVPDLKTEAEEVVKHWHKSGIRFVYIDQLLDHLGITTDHYNTKEVRNVLIKFHSLLVKYRITVLATMHPNKRGDTPRARMAGSPALWQPCRSAFYLAVHPEDEDVRVLLNIKNNRAAQKAPAIEFEIVDSSLGFRVGGRRIRTGVVHILTEDSILTVDRVLGSRRAPGLSDRMVELDGKLGDALSLNGGMLYSELREDEYFGKFTFNTLKRSLGRIHGTVGSHSPGSPSTWLPDK
jgi:hypothetical protein